MSRLRFLSSSFDFAAIFYFASSKGSRFTLIVVIGINEITSIFKNSIVSKFTPFIFGFTIVFMVVAFL